MTRVYSLSNFRHQINSLLKKVIMSRDWINTNNGQGNVLRTKGITVDLESAAGDATVKPNANIAVINLVNVGAGASTLTLDASDSIIGDQIILLVATIGAAVITLDGDFAAGTISITDGVGAYSMFYNGTVSMATATPV